jgi:hypothetical protein
MLDNVKSLFEITSILSFLYSFATLMVSLVLSTSSYDVLDKDALKARIKTLKTILIFILAVFSFLMNSFLPSTKEMATIIIVPKIYNSISNNEELKKIPSQVIDLANSWLVNLNQKM